MYLWKSDTDINQELRHRSEDLNKERKEKK